MASGITCGLSLPRPAPKRTPRVKGKSYIHSTCPHTLLEYESRKDSSKSPEPLRRAVTQLTTTSEIKFFCRSKLGAANEDLLEPC